MRPSGPAPRVGCASLSAGPNHPASDGCNKNHSPNSEVPGLAARHCKGWSRALAVPGLTIHQVGGHGWLPEKQSRRNGVPGTGGPGVSRETQPPEPNQPLECEPESWLSPFYHPRGSMTELSIPTAEAFKPLEQPSRYKGAWGVREQRQELVCVRETHHCSRVRLCKRMRRIRRGGEATARKAHHASAEGAAD